jgi:hypothetical protein
MKSGRWREGVVEKRGCETPEIYDITGERTQKQQYRSDILNRETFT